MNIYYLKKFRKIAYNSVMIQRYRNTGVLTIVWRMTKEPFTPVVSCIRLDDAIKELRKIRRNIILTLLERNRKDVFFSNLGNKQLAKF